ncbi:MAG: oligosaccharide flippase family protein, partial [Candidatus Hydrogenedentes bacterium]|nr:oligosaccharide flippase family protein [Candidatus Hydrogenedentota bacterium]
GFIAGYALHPYRPRPTADWARARELWRFGRWVLVSAILGLLLGQGDDLFVGKMLGATALGLYQMAYRIASIPATEFAQRLAIVLFPAYSALQHDRPRLRNAYLKALRLSALVCFPVTGGLVVLAGDFTALLLGENWLAAVPVIRALALVGLLNSLVNARPLLLAMGRPEVNTRLQVLRLALIAVLIYPLTAGLGMVGTGAALCASALITETLALLTVLRLLGLPRRRAAGPLLLPMSSAAVMMGVVYALASWGVPGSRLAGFGLLILAGAAVYGGLALLHDVLFRTGNLALIREQLRALRGGGPGARR